MHAIRLEAWRARRILVYGGNRGMHTGVMAGMQRLEVRDRLPNEGLRIHVGISRTCMQRMRTCNDPRNVGGRGDSGQQRSRSGKEISSGRVTRVGNTKRWVRSLAEGKRRSGSSALDNQT
jgi:hypothetical protein